MYYHDPQSDLLNIEPTTRDNIQMPLTNQYFKKFETDFIAEPWNVPFNENIIPKSCTSKKKTRTLTLKTSVSRVQNRVNSVETPIARPSSCHHSQFIDLGIPQNQPTYPKILQRIVIQAQNKSSRKNSSFQYKQTCLKKILMQSKIHSQNSESNYVEFIQKINPIQQKYKNEDQLTTKFKFKLKQILH